MRRRMFALFTLGLLVSCDHATPTSSRRAISARAVVSNSGHVWAKTAWIGHAHNRIVNTIAKAATSEKYAGHGTTEILGAAERACRRAMNAEHVDSAICERFRPELFAGSTALERKGAHGGVRTTELSDFGVWTVYAQQVEAVVGTVDDPTSVSYQLDAIASAASADVSLTEEERDAVYNLCSFGTSSSGYWNYYLASVNGGTPIPSVGRQLVAIDVGGAITAMRGAKSPWALLGGASLASAAGLVAKLINGELQVQTPVYDICQDHPGAC